MTVDFDGGIGGQVRCTSSEYWYIPATSPHAVCAFAESQVMADHLRQVHLAMCSRDADEVVRGIALAADERADRLADQIRQVFKPDALRWFEDLDLLRSMPNQVSPVPRAVWVFGALAALASVRAAFGEAQALASQCGGNLAGSFRASLLLRAQTALAEWHVQSTGLLDRHPWVRTQAEHIDLVDLESPHPRFRIPNMGP